MVVDFEDLKVLEVSKILEVGIVTYGKINFERFDAGSHCRQ